MRFKDIKFLITRALKGMVPRSSSDRAQTSVELPWGGDKLRFDSLGDFEFALNARTGLAFRYSPRILTGARCSLICWNCRRAAIVMCVPRSINISNI